MSFVPQLDTRNVSVCRLFYFRIKLLINSIRSAGFTPSSSNKRFILKDDVKSSTKRPVVVVIFIPLVSVLVFVTFSQVFMTL